MKSAGRLAWWEWLCLTLLTAGGAALRLYQIGEQSIWLDEAFSVWMARRSLPEFFALIASIDQHPPLYYLLLNGWLRAAGDAETPVRALSVLFGVAAIPTAYLLARRLLGATSALAAALLLALSPFHVRFAQEARMYTLFTFTATVALLALAHLSTGDTRRRWWVVYVLFSAASLYVHNTAVLLVLAANCAVGAAALAARGRPDPGLVLPRGDHWLIAQGVVLLLWSPWLPTFLRQSRAVDNEFWIPSPTFGAAANAIRDFFSFYAPLGAVWIWVAIIAVVAFALAALAHKPALLTLLGALVVVPFAAELLISLRRPIFYDRTLIWSTVPLYVLIAAAVSRARLSSLPGAAAVGAILFANVISLRAYFDWFTKEQWREAANFVAERVGENNTILFNASWVQLPFDYYFERHDRPAREHGVPVDLFDAGVLEPKMTRSDIPALREAIAGASCVWLVYSHDWYTDPERIVPRVLGSEMLALGTTHFVGLEVQLYQQRSGPGCGETPP